MWAEQRPTSPGQCTTQEMQTLPKLKTRHSILPMDVYFNKNNSVKIQQEFFFISQVQFRRMFCVRIRSSPMPTSFMLMPSMDLQGHGQNQCVCAGEVTCLGCGHKWRSPLQRQRLGQLEPHQAMAPRAGTGRRTCGVHT